MLCGHNIYVAQHMALGLLCTCLLAVLQPANEMSSLHQLMYHLCHLPLFDQAKSQDQLHEKFIDGKGLEELSLSHC